MSIVPNRRLALVLWAPSLGLLAGCQGTIEDPLLDEREWTRPDLPDEELPDFAPAGLVLPRLTASQYRATLSDVFGDPIPATELEADTNPYLFYTIGAATTTVSELGVQQYEESAHTIADMVFGDAARATALLGCTPASPGDACVTSYLDSMGRRLFRRPLTTDEQTRWHGIATSLAGGDALRGLRYAVAGMLQSPLFLYRAELGEPDPADPTVRRYTGYEMASRLSFLLTNAAPSEELLDAAQAGELDTPEGIYEHASRMLESEESRAAVQAFFAQYFDLIRLDRVERDVALHPSYTPTLIHAMRTELELLVDDLVFREDGDMRTLYSTRKTFVNDELAGHYGISAPSANAVTFVPVELPESGVRRGVLTLGAFLTMNAHQTETSPTLRGKFVRERVLCQTVLAPPDNVNLDLSQEMGEAPRTLRERLAVHRDNPECAGCHAFLDPPGMFFEIFDGIGLHRTTEGGLPIDASGDLDGIPLTDASELGTTLRDDPRVPRCMVKQLYRHANGRLEEEGELRQIVELSDEFAASGYRFRDLLLALATSEGFRTARPDSSTDGEAP